MKKNKTILFATLIIGFIAFAGISGCKPEETTTPQTCTNEVKDGDETGIDCGGSCNACNAGLARIRTITYLNNGSDVDSFTYDNNSRQIKKIAFSGGGATILYQTATSYNSNTIIEDYGSDTYTHTLNSQGYVTSSQKGDGSQTMLYTYDSQGQMLTKINNVYDGSGNLALTDTTIQTWSAENIISSYYGSEANVSGTYIYNSEITTYTYYTDKLNTIGNENKEMSFLGKDSKNLAKVVTRGGSPSTFTYEFDANGRVAKELFE